MLLHIPTEPVRSEVIFDALPFIDSKEVIYALLTLETKKQIKKLPGDQYARILKRLKG